MELRKSNQILNKDFFNKIIAKIKQIYSTITQSKYFSFIFFLYFVGFIMFFLTLTKNNFTIPVSGDFTLQEIPFYYNGFDDWWESIVTGKFVMWDDSAMLGVNNIAANSFYYLFNPFFLILLIVPRSLMPQAQAFMMITKMVLAGLTMKLLLQKFKVKEETTWLVSLAYAFCGWNFYYLWFNHFLEVAVLLPLVLLGIENVLKDQKPMLLIISIFISGLTNYFFLISFCFCGVLYAGFRYFQLLKDYKEIEKEKKLNKVSSFMDIRLEVIVQGFFAFLTGLMLSSIILLPCFSTALSNTRVSSQTYLTELTTNFKQLFSNELSFNEGLKAFTDTLFVWPENIKDKQSLYPLIAFFTPNVSCFDSAVIANSGYDNSYASSFIYTPLMLLFIPSLIQSFKSRKVSTIIGLLGICLLMFTPFAYYCFSGFTSVAYARWYLFITVISCVFIAIQYDKREEMKIWTLDISLGVIIIIYAYLIYKSEYLIDIKMSNVKEIDERTLYLYAELVYVFLLYLYLRKHYKKVELTYDLRYIVAVEAIVMCNITLMVQGTASYQNLYQGKDNIAQEINITQDLINNDDEYYRLFSTTADRNGNNLGMMLGTPGLGTFHSIYNYELEDFLDWSQVQYGGRGGWSMGIHEKRINLDQFLGVKYYLLKKSDTNVPFGFYEYQTTDNHILYRNDNFIELGYAFDTIIPTLNYEDYFDNNQNGPIHYNYEYDGKYISIHTSSTTKETIFNEKAYLTGAIMYQEDLIEILGEDYINNENFNFISTRNDIAKDIYTTDNTLKDNLINVYKADWKESTFNPNKQENYNNLGSYSRSKVTNLTMFSYLDIDTSTLNIGEECSTRGDCYVTIQARMGENLDITLYGENELGEEYIITSDTHMSHNFSKSGDRKTQRGFYVNDKVTRIKIQVVETMNNNRYLLKPYITYEYEDTFNNQINKLKESPLLNVKHTTNEFTFDTEFNKNKMVVLQIPYDSGWSLKRIDQNNNEENIKLYKGQGGFISFLGQEGNYHYKLEYYTPLLKEGFYIMGIGVGLVSAYYITYTLIFFNKKRFQEKFNLLTSNNTFIH